MVSNSRYGGCATDGSKGRLQVVFGDVAGRHSGCRYPVSSNPLMVAMAGTPTSSASR
jgi:hypothetical protein